MTPRRWAGWTLFGCGVVMAFWMCALIGGWSPDIVRLAASVHGPSLANYSADTAVLAPLASQVIGDASSDQSATASTSGSPGGRGSASPTPTATASVSPSGPKPSPTLPIPSLPIPSLPVSTPTLPPTPSLPVATPTPPVLPTPPLP
jgi:hypothetical protein